VRAEAFVLGVMSSRVFDWLSRRLVEGNLTFEVLADLPIPIDRFGTELADRCVEIAGRLASVDARYAEWANEVGVSVGSVQSDSTKQDLIAELDAIVACLYGLDTMDVQHVFKTFHRGWQYQEYLDRVSRYMNEIGQNV
jgi:hypothetical protein